MKGWSLNIEKTEAEDESGEKGGELGLKRQDIDVSDEAREVGTPGDDYLQFSIKMSRITYSLVL